MLSTKLTIRFDGYEYVVNAVESRPSGFYPFGLDAMSQS